MNERTEILTNNYDPILAITVYRTRNSIDGKGEYYLESHDITDHGAVMQGKPLLQETLQGIVDVFFDETKNRSSFSGMIPDNLLSFTTFPGGNYRMIWYRPAEERVLHFAEQLKIPTEKAWVPAMLYVATLKNLKVFSLNSNARPKENTKIFMAPFFNTGGDGNVCLGNAIVKKPKDKTYANMMQYWEDLYWLSEFTHVNGTDAKTKTKLIPLWQKIMKSKKKPKWGELNELKQYGNHLLKTILK